MKINGKKKENKSQSGRTMVEVLGSTVHSGRTVYFGNDDRQFVYDKFKSSNIVTQIRDLRKESTTVTQRWAYTRGFRQKS